jgi:hypothetical protein
MPLALSVTRFLEEWGWPVKTINPAGFRNQSDPPVNAFLDYELLSNMSLTSLDQLRGQPAFLLQQTRIYDSTLRDLAGRLKRLAHSSLESQREHDVLLQLIDQVASLATPEDLMPAQAGMMGSHPSFQLDMLIDAVEKVSFVEGIPLLMQSKSSFEWSHKAPYYLVAKGQHESFLLKQVIARLSMNGLYGWGVVHPHAEDEALFLSEQFGLPLYASINPQNGCRVNGISIELERIVGPRILNDTRFNPFGSFLREHYSPENTVMMSADGGALWNVYLFTTERAHGFRMMGSKGCRKSEGKKEYLGELSHREAESLGHDLDRTVYLDSLESYLDERRSRGKNGGHFHIIILDDKNNTMNTADGAAGYMKNRVKEYNEMHGTNYLLDVELWVTHMRTPDLEIVKRQLSKMNISKVVCLDTVNFVPNLTQQLKQLGIDKMVEVLDGSSYQTALGIVVMNAIVTGQYVDPGVEEVISRRKSMVPLLRIDPHLAPNYQKWGPQN